MLYVTTRNNRDAFTPNRVLHEDRCPDGGLYLPFHPPHFAQQDLEALAEKPFNHRVAEVLNLLFRTKLTGWDIDFAAGRQPVRLTTLRHRIHIAQTWYNPEWSYESLQNRLTGLLCEMTAEPTDWVAIAVRIAVLFGIYGELRNMGIGSADIALVTGDFSAPISAWYARQWGLPVGNIICCCNENKNLWELICYGQLRTDAITIQTDVPEADVAIPTGLERLIYGCGGAAEVERYLDACRCGRMYCPGDAVLSKLRKGLNVSVVSNSRLERVVPNVYRTHGCLMSSGTALAYAGLLDYRAKTGVAGDAVVLAEKSVAADAQTVAKYLGITAEELQNC